MDNYIQLRETHELMRSNQILQLRDNLTLLTDAYTALIEDNPEQAIPYIQASIRTTQVMITYLERERLHEPPED